MAWSQSDIDALRAAMGQGVKKVRYVSGEVEYQSLADMRSLLKQMESEVNPATADRRRAAVYSSGF
jgi:hypothetical protein